DTIPETESDKVIKSSVEDLVPIPSESKAIPNKICDVPLCENTTPLNALNEHSEIVVDYNDDSTSSDDDSYENIDYVDASPPDDEIVTLETVENSIPESGTFSFNLEEISSGSPTTHSDLSLPDYKAFYFPPADRSDFCHEEFADELAQIISPPEYDHFCFKIEPELGNLTMDVVNDIFPTR
ncbi:hypothetical protein Tco_0063081, partial [Tanacetum coccineum]